MPTLTRAARASSADCRKKTTKNPSPFASHQQSGSRVSGVFINSQDCFFLFGKKAVYCSGAVREGPRRGIIFRSPTISQVDHEFRLSGEPRRAGRFARAQTPPRRQRRADPRPGALPQRGVHAARVATDVAQGLAARRRHQRHPGSRRLLHLRDRSRVDPGHAPRRWKRQSVLQRLPAPREPRGPQHARQRRSLHLRIPRLEVPLQRQPQGHHR